MVDRVYVPGRKNPVELRQADGALAFIAVLRDEAHRSSNEQRRRLGKRQTLRSVLDDIAGLGPKSRARLLKTLGSMDAIKSAPLDTLIEAGITRRQAQAVYNTFHTDPQQAESAEQTAIDNAFVPDNS